MIYEWDTNLETGNAIIDNQHRQLFAALNKLVLAFELGEGEEELKITIEFLISYTYKHFNDEEKLMEQYVYPDKNNHKKYHIEFTKTVDELSGQLAKEGYSNGLVKITIQTVSDWLIHHIKGDDFKLASHIQTIEKGK